MRKHLLAVIILPFVWAAASQAQQLTQEEKESDLMQVVSLIKSSYGPLTYKNEQRSLSIDLLHAQYLERIRATESNGGFYYLVNQFVAEFDDSHFSMRVPSDLVAQLGFLTDLVAGEVVIEYVDRSKLNEEEFPFERGDTIVSVDGVAAMDLAPELASYRGMGNPLSALRVGAAAVSRRVGSGLPIPRGEVKVVVRPRLQPWVEKEVVLTWDVSGSPIDEDENKDSSGVFDPREFQISLENLYTEIYGPRTYRSFRCSGDTRTKIPADATLIMKEPFVAYYHPTAKGNVGYLRIPHYYPQNDLTGEAEFELRLSQYQYALSILEENTVGLIIDQDHNCGGSVDYLEKMVALFMAEPFAPLQFRFLATKAEYLQFRGWFESMPDHTAEKERFGPVVELVKASWEAREPLTPMTSFSGDGMIRPNQHYSKPVVMLIDEMSGSGGDAFPAMMQGLGRALLVGQRTMGAGGHVQAGPDLFYSSMSIRLTKSLFFRPDGVAVENNGVEPDVEYSITLNDFVNEYTEYQAFYLNELFKLLD